MIVKKIDTRSQEATKRKQQGAPKLKLSALASLCLKVSFLLLPLQSFSAEKYDLVVAQDGTGNFTTIQQAIDASKAFPDSRVRIFVKNGTYKEKLVVPSCNSHLSVIGESADKTIISYDDHFNKINRGRNSTFYTYTLKVEANDFHLEILLLKIPPVRSDRQLRCMLRAIAVFSSIAGFWEIRIPYMPPEGLADSISTIATSKEPPILFLAKPRRFSKIVSFMPKQIHFSQRPALPKENRLVLFS